MEKKTTQQYKYYDFDMAKIKVREWKRKEKAFDAAKKMLEKRKGF